MKIYLAGPLFTTAEREFNVEVASMLGRFGHVVHLPQNNEPRDRTARNVFLNDVAGVDWADVVVACMDGPDPDSGTCWECGYAYKKKPVIVFRSDFRAGDDSKLAPYNLMLTESANIVLNCEGMKAPEIARKIAGALEYLGGLQ